MVKMNTYRCNMPVPLKPVPNVASPLGYLLGENVNSKAAQGKSAFHVNDWICQKFWMLALKTHDIADAHLIFKPNRNIIMTYFLAHLWFRGEMNVSWYRQWNPYTVLGSVNKNNPCFKDLLKSYQSFTVGIYVVGLLSCLKYIWICIITNFQSKILQYILSPCEAFWKDRTT